MSTTIPAEVVRCLLAAGENNLLSQSIAGKCTWRILKNPTSEQLGTLEQLGVEQLGDLEGEAPSTTDITLVILSFEGDVPATMRFILRDGCPAGITHETRGRPQSLEYSDGFWFRIDPT